MSRHLAAAAVVTLWAVSAIGTATVAHERATLDIDISVTDYGNLSEQRTVTDLRLTVHNHEPDAVPITVATWTQHRKTQHPWDIVRGPSTLPPGETATLVIEARHPLFGIRPGDPAQITIKTPDGQRRAATHVTIPAEVANATAG